MAQLYKMTLYVCDLEENLSLDEIETLIKQDALDGVAVNCICHFADHQIGKRVEWDDDIDLNECNCPTSTWDKYFTPPKKTITNADRIRAMSDEELKYIARAVIKSEDCPMGETECTDCVFHDLCLRGDYYYNNEEEWLQQPAEVDNATD